MRFWKKLRVAVKDHDQVVFDYMDILDDVETERNPVSDIYYLVGAMTGA